MPRKPIDFSKGLIYQIEKEGIVYYVGSTTNFTKRKSGHKTACNNENDNAYHYPIYEFIRNNGGWDEFNMILIEYYKCNNKNELEAREQHFINEFNTHLLNKRYASRTKKQYNQDNKIEIATKKIKYRQDNKEKIAIRDEIYRRDNKVELAIKKTKYTQDNKEHKQEYDRLRRNEKQEYDRLRRNKKKLLNPPTPSIV